MVLLGIGGFERRRDREVEVEGSREGERREGGRRECVEDWIPWQKHPFHPSVLPPRRILARVDFLFILNFSSIFHSI